MSAPDRRAMLDRADRALSVRRQCALLGVARSGVYRPRKPANDNDAALMRRIDELFTAWPFLGSRRMTAKWHAPGRQPLSAWSRSAMRSSGFSIPTERRISAGVIPRRIFSSGGTSEWVMAAGCEASVSVPPRLTASLITSSRSKTAKASASPPRTSKLKVEPAPLH